MILLAYAIPLPPPITFSPVELSINKRQSTQSPTFDVNYINNLIDTAHRNNVLVRIRIFN